MRARYPDLPFPEITKRLGAEWTRLSQSDKQVQGLFARYVLVILLVNIKHIMLKFSCFWVCWGDSQRYLDEAEREKMQYAQELKEYQQTEAYHITSANIHDKRIKKGEGPIWFLRTFGAM